jgi:mRNA interferase MazF
VLLSAGSFGSGGLGRESVARPGKLFTASQSLFVKAVGSLTAEAHRDLVSRVVEVLQSGVR